MTTRRDRVCVMARWHEPPPPGERGVARGRRPTTYGPNCWFDANLNSVQLATAVIRLLDIEPLPAAPLTQASLFDDLRAA